MLRCIFLLLQERMVLARWVGGWRLAVDKKWDARGEFRDCGQTLERTRLLATDFLFFRSSFRDQGERIDGLFVLRSV